MKPMTKTILAATLLLASTPTFSADTMHRGHDGRVDERLERRDDRNDQYNTPRREMRTDKRYDLRDDRRDMRQDYVTYNPDDLRTMNREVRHAH